MPSLSAFVAYRHTGEDPAQLQEMLELVCAALQERGVDTYCTFFSEAEFQDKALSPRAIMQHAFAEIDKRDFLFIVQASNSKSEGMLLEIGYCWGVAKPVVAATRSDLGNTYVPDMTAHSFRWSSYDDLCDHIRTTDFATLIAK